MMADISVSIAKDAFLNNQDSVLDKDPWKLALQDVITEVAELQSILKIPSLPYEIDPAFPFKVPRSFVARMQAGNPHDPLLLQVLPQKQEQEMVAGFITDPLQEQIACPVPGIMHKFASRLLLTVTGFCAVHCRYCFRQHFPYHEHDLTPTRWQPMLDYIAQHTEVREVILSGGDPLLLKNKLLLRLRTALTNIPHVRCIRIHTRLPVVIPERIDSGLLDIMRNCPVPIVLVLHCNHANELDQVLQDRLAPLRKIPNVTLLNQSVLLHKINDSAEVLADLSERLFECGVLPYYLHMLDKTQGTAHFAVSTAQAQSIMWQLHERLSGYLVPKLMRELPQMPGKLPVALGACPWLQG